jgi:2-polyprenyl-6-hydroxyphenyl methylase/3-demethylubiquinone-9 3-methyltransferase
MEPYYFRLRDVKEFLEHYLHIYKGDYNRTRAEKVVRLFPCLIGKKVLDMGSGGGFYSLAASKKGCKDITTLDVSHVCVKAARLNLRKNANLDAKGVIADATNIPFIDECFDFIICVDLIEHIKADRKLLREIRRVLKNSGFLVIATQNSNSLNYLLESFIQRYILKNRNWMGWDPTHVRFYTPKTLIQLLKGHGFSIIKLAGTYYIPYMAAFWFKKFNTRLSKVFYVYLHMLNRMFENRESIALNLFGWGIMCLCQK